MAPLALTTKQTAVWHSAFDDPAIRRILLDGGARSTKTVLSCCWLIGQAATYPGALILMARKVRDHARNSLYKDTLHKLVGRRRDIRFHDGDMELRFRNGSIIRVDGLDTKERVDKILGTEYDHIFFNEASQMTWETVTTVLTRLARGVVPVRKAIFDCNPKSQRHWLYKAGVLRQDPTTGAPLKDAATWARQSWTPYDNPHLPADALATLEALTGSQRRRMLLGEWCDAEGAVYSEFNEDHHVLRGPLPSWVATARKLRGIDFGYTNPFVCLWGAIGPDGQLLIYRERYRAMQTVRIHAAAILAAERADCVTVADHDAEDRATLHECGIQTIAAKKDIRRGIAAVKDRLRVQANGRTRFQIHEECRESIAEFYDYCWPPGADGKNEKEIPVDDRNHSMDTVRYMVMHLDARGSSFL